MGYGNKSVSGIHPILKHMNKLGGNPEIKYDPIAHDEKGMGRGGKLGTAEYGKMKDGMGAYGKMKDSMPAYGHGKDKGMPGYKSDAQRKAVHASKAEKGSAAYGKKSYGMPKHGKMHGEGMPKHGKMHNDGMAAYYGKKSKGMPKHGKIHKKDTGKGYSVMTDSKGVKVNIKNK